MAYKCMTDGMAELGEALSALGDAAQGAASRGLYEAAGVYADAVGKAVNGIAVSPFRYASRKRGEVREPSPEERAMLQGEGAIGIAKFHKTGVSVDTSVGFNNSGYVPVLWRTKRHRARTNYKIAKDQIAHSSADIGSEEDMKPVPVIANAINSGTSFMKKQPFFRKAINQAKKSAEDAFEASVVETLNAAANGNDQSGN